MATDLGLWVNSRPLMTVGAWGDLAWSTLADGGCGDLSWSMQLPLTSANPLLRMGSYVEVRAGGFPLDAGIMAQPDINTDGDGLPTWSFTATGLAKTAAGMICFDGSGNTTSTPDTAIDAAIATGLRWKRPNSISSAAFTPSAGSGDQTDALNKLTDLLDAWALSQSQRWGVDALGNVYAAADPTTPSWYMTPNSGRFGLADDDYASDIYVRYLTAGGTYATAHAGDTVAGGQYGIRQQPVDATSYGVLSSTQANGLAAGALAAGAARLGWTNPVSPNHWQITTPGGTPAPLWMIRGGQMVRLHGVVNEQGQPLPYVDFVIGEANYNAASDAITLSPVGLAARDLTSVIAKAVGVAA